MAIGETKLTNSTDETSVGGLYSADLVFGIPYFQRAYKWTEKNIERFVSDLDGLLDYEDTSHFLGAIIIFAKPTKPSDSNYYEVIDGQQRLTTCYLALIALAKTLITYGQIDEAIGLYERYLVITRKTSYSTNAKLICCKEDRAGMNRIFHDLLGNSEFKRIVQDNNNEYNYLQMIERVIERLADNCFKLKSWAVALVSIVSAFAINGAEEGFIILPIIPLIAFWMLDAYYLKQERKYRILYRNVIEKEDYLYNYSLDTHLIQPS